MEQMIYSDGGNESDLEMHEASALAPGAFVRISREQQAEIDADLAAAQANQNLSSERCFESQSGRSALPNQGIIGYKQQLKRMRPKQKLATEDEAIPRQLSVSFTALMQAANQGHYLTDWTMEEVTVRMEHLESVWQAFQAIWQTFSARSISEEMFNKMYEIFGESTKTYLGFKAKLLTQLHEKNTGGSNKSVSEPLITSKNGQLIQIQLSEPPKLSKFSGLEVDWVNFRAMFEAEVHNNDRFSNAQKMRYLLDSLQGRAAQIYKNWPIVNDDSYAELWTAICYQYSNEYNTIRAHAQELYGLKPLYSPTCEQMQRVLDTARSAFRQLRLLLTPGKVAEYMLLHQLESILDADSQTQWTLRRSAHTLPSLEEMYNFLETRASLLEQLSTTRLVMQNNHHHFTSSNKLSTTVERGASTGRADESRPECYLCPGAYHWPFRCIKFKAMPVAERQKYVTEHRMCYNCFSLRHIAAKCPDKPCPRCHTSHNSCLCTVNSNVVGLLEAPNRMERKPEELFGTQKVTTQHEAK